MGGGGDEGGTGDKRVEYLRDRTSPYTAEAGRERWGLRLPLCLWGVLSQQLRFSAHGYTRGHRRSTPLEKEVVGPLNA